MTAKEDFQEFLKVLLELRERVREEGALVLVEGERDRSSLEALGLPRRAILKLHRGETIVEVADALVATGRPVVLLTDWDRKGAELFRRLRSLLNGSPIPVDGETRRRIAKALRGEIVEVEGLHAWAERSSQLFHLPLGYRIDARGGVPVLILDDSMTT